MMSGLQSGITHLLFSPCGNFLFSGERKVTNTSPRFLPDDRNVQYVDSEVM